MASFQSAPVLVGVEQPQVCDEMGHVVAGRNGSAGAASAPDGWDIAAGYAARGQLETAGNPGTSGINPPGPSHCEIIRRAAVFLQIFPLGALVDWEVRQHVGPFPPN